jgi:hypothetical protein
MDSEGAVFFFSFVVILIFYGLPFLRHRPWVSKNFSGYAFGPDLPSAAFFYVIPVSVLMLSPLIYKLAPDLWATIGIWWLGLGLALELCWLWVIVSPRSCRKCGRSTEAYRSFRSINDESSEWSCQLSYYYVCHLCRQISRRLVSGLGRD